MFAGASRIFASKPAIGLAFASALAGLLTLTLCDLITPSGQLRASSLLAAPLLQGFEPPAEDGSRRGDGASTIRLGGLWRDSACRIHLVLTAKGGPRRIRVFSNDGQVADVTLDNSPQVVSFDTRSSPAGELLLQIHGGRREETVYRLSAVRLEQDGPRRIPGRRALEYLVLGGLIGFLAASVAGLGWGRWIAAGLLIVLGSTIVIGRAQFLPHLDAAVMALGVVALLRGLALWIESVAGMPVWASWPALVISAARIVAVCDLGFGSIDAEWHTHQLVAFKSGQLVESTAPGVARSPYPPAFYAVVRPFWSGDYWTDVRLVRVAMAVIEGASPFLVFAIGMALGLGAVPAGVAALLAGCMPEGILVLEKGIAANILGQFALLLCVLLFARRSHWVLCWAAATLLLLSHAAAAALGVLLLVSWWALELRAARLDRRGFASRTAILAVAGVAAWAIYYREVSLGFGHPNRADEAIRFLQPHWYRLAKIAQDLVLKFGGLPVVLAALGLGQLREIPLLRPLALAWGAIVATFAAVAVLTPFPLRFEYFAVPLVALLGGALAAARPQALRWCWWSCGFALVVQVALGILWRFGYFDVIAVILESPRWR